MAAANQEPALGRISPETVREATGRDWEGWLEALDAAGAAAWSHKEIVAHLERAHPQLESGWWRQSIAVGYERARGKRVVGQTADARFQLGVSRTVAASAADVWELLTSRPDLWLGEGASVAFKPGERYEVPATGVVASAQGEIRVVKPHERLRMTWQPGDWPAPATLQLSLAEPRPGKTTVTAHLEKLPDADARDAMRERWSAALERLVAGASAG